MFLWLHGILPVGIQMTDVHHLRIAELKVHSVNTTRYPWRQAVEQEIIREPVVFRFHCHQFPTTTSKHE